MHKGIENISVLSVVVNLSSFQQQLDMEMTRILNMRIHVKKKKNHALFNMIISKSYNSRFGQDTGIRDS